MLHEGVSRGLVDACSSMHKVRSGLRHDTVTAVATAEKTTKG